ncbi:hypothetical protein [Azospirillum brasilense]|uniref:hypothetical protein n=1 Tax=Azospirillum brasilense TaxID=192 RepID=UPI0011EBBF96|nr:hypothetical protein [Azospirillum brasilense]
MVDPALPEFSFTDELRRRIFTEYVTFLSEACRVFRMPLKHLEYSDRELALAVAEAEIDLRAVLARRSRTHGITPGKIAGVLAFRLSRFKIVHFNPEGWGNPNLYLIQEMAAVLLVKRLFVRGTIPEISVLELSYQLSRRHANQETAGLFFDAFATDARHAA